MDQVPESQPSNLLNADLLQKQKENSLVFMLSFLLHLAVLLIISLVARDAYIKDVHTIKDIIAIKEVDYFPEEILKIKITPVSDVEKPMDMSMSMDEKENLQKQIEENASGKNKTEIVDETTLPNLIVCKPEEIIPDFINDHTEKLEMPAVGRVGSLPTGNGHNLVTSRSRPQQKQSVVDKNGQSGVISSVDAALAWLAAHQEADGSWHANKYDGSNKDHFSTTAMAILPFLGSGHCERYGKYKNTVSRGIRHLNATLIGDRNNGRTYLHGRNYGSAIALCVLSEASIFGSSASTKKHANEMADMFIKMHSQGALGGWNYTGAGTDLSVSGWIAVGLKSGKMASLAAIQSADGKKVLAEYSMWVDRDMTNPATGLGIYQPGRKGNRNMTWVGMVQKQFLGFPHADPFLLRATEKSLAENWINQLLSGDGISDSYAIYYGALASFQQGGDMWKSWNTRMHPFLMRLQCQGNPADLGGSWNPGPCLISKNGGRVMVTALMALSLQVYWRNFECLN